jgi:hypothetical protein
MHNINGVAEAAHITSILHVDKASKAAYALQNVNGCADRLRNKSAAMQLKGNDP